MDLMSAGVEAKKNKMSKQSLNLVKNENFHQELYDTVQNLSTHKQLVYSQKPIEKNIKLVIWQVEKNNNQKEKKFRLVLLLHSFVAFSVQTL